MSYIAVEWRRALVRLAAPALAAALILFAAQLVLAAPPPDFTWTPTSPQVGELVSFTATSLRPNSTVQWDFQSDGTVDATSTTARPSAQYLYLTPGEKKVTMRVTRPNGDRPVVVIKTIRVTAPTGPPPANQAPTASFSASPNPAAVGQTVSFDASASRDPDGPIAGYQWDLDGNGSYETDTGRTPTVSASYSSAGTVPVKLRVTDEDGATDAQTVNLTVTSPPGSTSTGTAPFVVVVEPPPSGPELLSPFPVVRIVGHVTRTGTRVRLLAVRGPRGVKVTVRCAGRGCSFRRKSRLASAGRVRFAFKRTLRPGARIAVLVTKRDRIGKYTLFRVRRGRGPARRDQCLWPAERRPRACPSA
jgi:PKD repeat protein